MIIQYYHKKSLREEPKFIILIGKSKQKKIKKNKKKFQENLFSIQLPISLLVLLIMPLIFHRISIPFFLLKFVIFGNIIESLEIIEIKMVKEFLVNWNF